jgi:hypothetical protein
MAHAKKKTKIAAPLPLLFVLPVGTLPTRNSTLISFEEVVKLSQHIGRCASDGAFVLERSENSQQAGHRSIGRRCQMRMRSAIL